MARSYAFSIQNGAVTTTSNFCGAVNTAASPTVRPKFFEFEFGSSITPADNSSRVLMQRLSTAAPTGGNTAQAGVPLDPADPASLLTGYSANTGGTTLGTILFGIGVNMRATFRWIAAPTKEFVCPATQHNGAGIVVSSQTTSYNPDACVYWEE